MSPTDFKSTIVAILRRRGPTSATTLANAMSVSRQYVNRFLRELKEEGKIALIGKTNRARYVIVDRNQVAEARRQLLSIHRILHNEGLAEDIVLDEIKRDTGIFMGLPENIARILEYSFTEILNNAIEHSQSSKIDLTASKTLTDCRFDVIDHGVGIFNKIIKARGLQNEMEAIQDLLKGKQTTDPQDHTGEGIFFTSKVVDTMTIRSSGKKLIFNNRVDDIFVHDIKQIKGTRVTCVVSLRSQRKLDRVFREYTTDSYEFGRTVVAVRLYKMGSLYISRSQARRIMSGLEKFTTVVLDFSHIKGIGQAFADEVFRVWQRQNPTIKLQVENADENTQFMIRRAQQGDVEGDSGQRQLFT